MIVAVDGPAAAGKGTIARKLAHYFNLAYLDTGTLYRAVALSIIVSGENQKDPIIAAKYARSVSVELALSPDIRSNKVSQLASHIAAIPAVREALLDRQRNFANNPGPGKDGAILDGRDIATIVCPNADFKIFITADVEIRAKRRLKELLERNQPAIYCQVINELRTRDRRDSLRKEAPMLKAVGAMVLDTSELTVEEAFVIARNYIAFKRF